MTGDLILPIVLAADIHSYEEKSTLFIIADNMVTLNCYLSVGTSSAAGVLLWTVSESVHA